MDASVRTVPTRSAGVTVLLMIAFITCTPSSNTLFPRSFSSI